MAYTTAPELLAALAPLLKQRPGSLAEYWTDISEQAAEYAEADIKAALLARGFTAAQILTWDRLGEFSRKLGCWHAIILGGMYSGFDGAALQALDVRPELKSVLVYANGVWIEPPSGQPGTVTTAGPSVGNTGVFAYDDSEDDLGIQW